ncbi:MAG TPA: ABC transporter permease [Solirubrobacterales bacterium]|nr:ABC transporter permease [Solirubrobacterales bacterium]
MIEISLLATLGIFGEAIDFIFSQQEAVTGGVQVGGIAQVLELTWTHFWLSVLALLVSVLIAVPVAAYLGHRGTGEFLAVAIGNAGRAIPELALIALLVAYVGVGTVNLLIVLVILGVPPILTNTFVGIRQVDRATVQAARGVGLTEGEIMRRVELPLAVPTIMSGVRTSMINIVATATIAPLAAVLTLGDFILSRNVYGDAGVLAGAILVALLALAFEGTLALIQRLLTPKGLRLADDS